MKKHTTGQNQPASSQVAFEILNEIEAQLEQNTPGFGNLPVSVRNERIRKSLSEAMTANQRELAFAGIRAMVAARINPATDPLSKELYALPPEIRLCEAMRIQAIVTPIIEQLKHSQRARN